MTLAEWDAVFRALADEPGLFQRQGGVALFTRHGEEQIVELTERPGAGLAIPVTDGGTRRYVPVASWIQREVLGLPTLARQIQRVLEKAWAVRPTKFVDGPADFRGEHGSLHLEQIARELPERLLGVPGTTHVLQLMAAAGRGKTALIEHLAMESANKYQPEEHPYPLLLPVDLLGRYVGTVDDAIAGSLNNTYFFPGLSQKDIALALRKKWLILALDGFDELVARVGVRDAFNRITELLDQLEGAGTVVLSAREAFFELYQISSAIRTYLQPRVGSYTTSTVSLLRWERRQGIEVFRSLQSSNPEGDLDALSAAFDHDAEIVYHPFHLTRLARLWVKEQERFASAGDYRPGLARSRYVIDTYINREVTEKWIDREGRPLLGPEGHITVLGAIAEEMWRSGAFRLSSEEFRIAAQIGLSELEADEPVRESALERLPTHAAFVYREPWFSFAHDMFLHYFLGVRLALLIERQERDSILGILRARELGPQIVAWVGWSWGRREQSTERLVKFLTSLSADGAASPAADNLAQLCAQALRGYEADTPAVMRGLTFTGDSLAHGNYRLLRFEDCNFWQVDLTGCDVLDSLFLRCTFAGIRVDATTRLTGSEFRECRFSNLDVADEYSLFSPDEIEAWLKDSGASWLRSETQRREPAPLRKVSEEMVRCLERYVRMSRRTWDIAVGDVEERFGEEPARAIARIGLEAGVLREAERPASGPRKWFVRFRVDRDKLLRGQTVATGDKAIDSFWDKLRESYPQN